MQLLNNVVLNKELLNKKIKVGVAFMPVMGMGAQTTKYFEGIATSIGQFGSEGFLILENNVMLNIKYIQTIEIIG